MRDVAVIGVSMLKFGRYPEKDVPELGAQAALLALNDAGVSLKDVEIMASGNLFQANATVGQRILQEIGQTGIPVINVANACATGSTAFREAYCRSPRASTTSRWRSASSRWARWGCWAAAAAGAAIRTEGIVGSGLMPAVFGQAGMEHMRKYGTTQEQFAKVAVKNHKHSMRESAVAVPGGDVARGRDERAHGGVPEHALHVLPDGRRRGGGDRSCSAARLRKSARSGQGAGVGADVRSVDASAT